MPARVKTRPSVEKAAADQTKKRVCSHRSTAAWTDETHVEARPEYARTTASSVRAMTRACGYSVASAALTARRKADSARARSPAITLANASQDQPGTSIGIVTAITRDASGASRPSTMYSKHGMAP